MKKSFLLAVLFAASAAQTQNLKIVAVHFGANASTPNNIQFLCSQKYDRAECVKDATALRQAMTPYPVQLLGPWSFVLVPADDWKALVRGQGGDPVSPAFSMLDQRVTLLDASLFSGSAGRNKELMVRFAPSAQRWSTWRLRTRWGTGSARKKTSAADDYGKDLRAGKTPDCSKTPGWKLPTTAVVVHEHEFGSK